MTNRQKLLISLITSTVLSVLLCLLIWLIPLTEQPLIWSGISILIIVSSAYGGYMWWRTTPETAQKKQQKQAVLKRQSQLLAKHFDRMLTQQKQKKRLTSRYDQPIYLYLSEQPKHEKNVISQMGFEAYKLDEFGNDIDFPILFWLSESAILISISLGDDQQAEFLDVITKKLNQWRPSQAANGILLSTPISQLLASKEVIQQAADQQRSHIQFFNQKFGLNLPIYNLISDIGELADFCQYFSAFEETKRDDAFGATMPVNRNGGIDATWFDQSFNHLIEQLMANMSRAIAGQLNPLYRNAIASAPYQLGLLKQNLWLFFKRLYRQEQLNRSLHFRGYYLIHGGNDKKQHDLLAATLAHELGHEVINQSPLEAIKQTLFAQHLMGNVILPEQALVGVNKQKENTRMLTQGAYITCCALLFIGLLTVLKFNFDFQSMREERADLLLERYKEAIAAAPYDLENMAENLPNLYSLYQIYDLYQQPEPWFSKLPLPSPSIKQQVEDAYYAELEAVLLPSMVKTIEKDLFVYVNLEDQPNTLNIMNNYKLLFSKDKPSSRELIDYYEETLKAQSENNSINTAQLNVLLQDVFEQKLVPQSPNQDLQLLAAKVINQSGLEALIYQHIRHLPQFSRRIDLSKELGSAFFSSFRFDQDFVGYLVPNIFTPNGFQALDLSVTSPLLKEALADYAGVAGKSPSPLEVYRISRNLNIIYQNEYIQFWREFISQVKVVPFAGDVGLKNSFERLASTTQNPLQQLYQTLHRYTYIDVSQNNTEMQASGALSTLTSKLPGDKLSADLLAMDKDKAEIARQIALSFQNYHQLLAPDPQGITPLDQLQQQVAMTNDWLSAYYNSATPDSLAFETLAKPLQGANPLAALYTLSSSHNDLIKKVVQRMCQQGNSMLLSLAGQHINKQWQQLVYSEYQQKIAAYYPFNPNAKQQAGLKNVQQFFSSKGTLEQFISEKLSAFSSLANGEPAIVGFLPRTQLTLNAEVWPMIMIAREIQNALYQGGPDTFGLSFTLKAHTMSSELTRFDISAEQSLFRYRHGPALWQQITWSDPKQLEYDLTVTMNTPQAQVLKKEVAGPWSWFKLLSLPADSDSRLVEIRNEQYKMVLELHSDQQTNPFLADFFTRLHLPASL
ncbi:type VI secretion system membrane subunit TssM [Motilimonas cestriensis]|uniref:type VI secretion system membrane subunit TssM n=1 Tax=Motilimonas cestriensis TaxID=2742685 RepID=UPI003DA5A77A